MSLGPGPSIQPPFAGGLAPDSDGVLVRQSPFTTVPRGNTAIDKSFGPQTIAPVGGLTELPPSDNEPLVVPGATQFRISHLGFGSLDPAAYVFAIYTIFANGKPVNGYINQPVSVGTLDQPGEVTVLVPGPALVQIFILNQFPLSAFSYSARIRGWFYQEQGR